MTQPARLEPDGAGRFRAASTSFKAVTLRSRIRSRSCPLNPPSTPDAPVEEGQQPIGQGKDQLLESLFLRNSDIQRQNTKRQEEQFFNDESGGRVEAVK